MISPLARRLRLGAEIRAIREAAGMTGTELARKAGVDRTVASKIEAGAERRSLDVVLRLLDALMPQTDDRYMTLMRVARDGLARGWWEKDPAYAGMGDRQARTADLEAGVYSIRAYQSSMLPGLLQTEAYARYRAEVGVADGAELDIDGTVAGRLRRQELIASDAEVVVDVVLEPQAVLRPPVPPGVMRGQLLHVLDLMATRSTLRVRVLPVDAPVGPGFVPRSPFSIYTYPDPGDLTLVAVDTVDADRLVTAPADAGRYARLFDQVRDAALAEDASADLIQKAADAIVAA